MQPEMILKSDALDILFENRNKEYGAYTLRREYNTQLTKAIAITFSIAALLLLFSFNSKTEKNPPLQPMIADAHPIQPPPKQNHEKPKPPKSTDNGPIKKSVQPVAMVKPSTKPIVVADEKADTNIIKVVELKNKDISDIKSDGIKNPNDQNIFPAKGGGGSGGGKKQGGRESTETAPNIPIDNPDVYPKFPGDDGALKKFLERNLRKPGDAEDGKTAEVKIRFVVNPDGSISGFDVIQSGGDEFDSEVLRVLKKMPHWIPGKSNGKDVSVYFVVPVKFVNEED